MEIIPQLKNIHKVHIFDNCDCFNKRYIHIIVCVLFKILKPKKDRHRCMFLKVEYIF